MPNSNSNNIKKKDNYKSFNLRSSEEKITIKNDEDKLKDLFNVAGESIWLLDLGGKILAANNSAAKRLEKDKKNMIGGNFFDLLPQKTALERKEKISLAFKTAETINFEDGRNDMVFHNSVYPVKDKDGKVNAVAFFSRDITKSKQAEKKLRRSEERYRLLAETMLQGVIHQNADGRIIAMNPAAKKILGKNPEDFLSAKTIHDLPRAIREDGSPFPEEDHPSAIALRTGKQVRGTIMGVYNPKKEEYRWISIDAVPINYSDKKQTGEIYIIFEDLTELKKADEEKSNFIAMMSHELRNPLTPILAAAQFVESVKKNKSADIDPQIKNPLNIIQQQSKNMARLLDDLLDISRISRGKITLKKRSISLQQTVKRAVKSVNSLINIQKHKLSIQMPREPVYLEADRVRLEQIIINLLNNAIKYTRPGGNIKIIAGRSGKKALIAIEDNGIGIEKKHINSLFKLFSRHSKPFISTQGELGIGLKLTKELVSLHGGKISVESPGKSLGSKFIVELPALPENFTLDLEKDTSVEKKKNLKILVVDDNANIAKLFSKMMNVIGHEAKYCFNGASAIKMAAEYKPDLALIDIGLPDMSGHDIARKLRQMEKDNGKKIKLIAVTGYGQDEDFKRSYDAGFDLHLVKPVDLASLEKILNSLDFG